MTAAVSVLLAVAVLAGWVGCLGFARLRSPLDRLHCVAFTNAACGVPVLAAAVLADGFTIRVGKILLLVLVSLLTGAALSHATARALLLRGDVGEG